ncbi:TasA family protein [Brevibacillus sp. SYSU BS000544]|uniref:TasA family protein n=1 Tax=Brevibacillus sp. SYSU BS000544 TaxID=3416443 RepID=UPI003CE47786
MSLKKQFALTLASVGLGAALIGGGTFAYFSDTAEVNNTFAAGTLDLSVDPTVVFDVSNLKPGDSMERNFKLINSGSLDINEVLMKMNYTVTDANGNNAGEDLADHLRVEFLTADGELVFWKDKLSDLTDQMEAEGGIDIAAWYDGVKGLENGDEDEMVMKILFVDNDADQNKFQGDSMNLKFNLTATQTEGEEK